MKIVRYLVGILLIVLSFLLGKVSERGLITENRVKYFNKKDVSISTDDSDNIMIIDDRGNVVVLEDSIGYHILKIYAKKLWDK